jgi:hypothetical protein
VVVDVPVYPPFRLASEEELRARGAARGEREADPERETELAGDPADGEREGVQSPSRPTAS